MQKLRHIGGTMDEPDSTSTKSPEILAAEAARTAAQRKLSAERAQFSTPSWIGPARSGAGEAVIPAQLEPEHDDEPEIVIPVVSEHPVPDTAHWAERAKPRMFAGALLLASLA